MTVPMDKAGRVVLPKSIRDQLQLQAGDKFEVVVQGEEIVLRMSDLSEGLLDHNGLLVKPPTGRTLPQDLVDQTIRSLRNRSNVEPAQ